MYNITIDNYLRLCYNVDNKGKEIPPMKDFFKDTNTRPFAITITILLIILLGFCIWFVLDGETKNAVGRKPDYYALATMVCAIDRDTDVVTCEDYNGNLWEFYGVEDWQVGDNANLLMDTMDTERIYDDEICGATYGGWVLDK